MIFKTQLYDCRGTPNCANDTQSVHMAPILAVSLAITQNSDSRSDMFLTRLVQKLEGWR